MDQGLRILLLTANPTGTTQLRLDEEAREIESGLRRSNLRAAFDLRAQWAVRPRDIRRALLDYEPDIVHFSGHGVGEQGLAFEDDAGSLAVVPTDALASLFELFADRIKCILLNACYSEIQARAVAVHIEYVIGMQWELGDRAAIEFAVGFYDALGAGKSVPIAYRFGCNGIRITGLLEHTTPVLLTKAGAQAAEGPPASAQTPTRGEVAASRPTLNVASIADVLQWGWDGKRLLEALIRLDYQTTDELTHAHEGDPAQWGPVFMNHPETWRLLTTGPQAIVGYWHWAPLFPEDYCTAKAGQLLDSQITVDTLQFFELPGQYDLYFVQICMLPEYRRPHALQLLFDTVFEVVELLARDEIYIREVTANAYTPVGEAICRSFNMQVLCPHREHGRIYTAPVRAVLGHALVSRRVGLKRQYMNQGLA